MAASGWLVATIPWVARAGERRELNCKGSILRGLRCWADDLASASIPKTRRAATNYDIAPKFRKERWPRSDGSGIEAAAVQGNLRTTAEHAFGDIACLGLRRRPQQPLNPVHEPSYLLEPPFYENGRIGVFIEVDV